MGTIKAWLFKTTETDPRGVRRWHSQAVLGFLFRSQTLYLEIMSNIQKSCKNKNSIKNSQIHFHSLSVCFCFLSGFIYQHFTLFALRFALWLARSQVYVVSLPQTSLINCRPKHTI